jgi:hypothetical protein
MTFSRTEERMRTPASIGLAAGLLAAAGAVVFSLRSGAQAAPEAATRMCVVDVLTLVNTHPRFHAIDAKFVDGTAALKKHLEEEATKVDAQKRDFALLPRTDPTRAAKARAIAKAISDLEFEEKWGKGDLQRQRFDAYETLYLDVKADCKRVATELGYQVVLNKTDDPLDVKDLNEFLLNVAVRGVVAYDEAVNITSIVKDRIAANSGGGTPPVPPGMTDGPPPPTPMGM